MLKQKEKRVVTSVESKGTKAPEADVKSVIQPQNKPNYEVRVGLFFFFAMMLLIYGWTWLKSISFTHPPQLITVQFHDIAGLANNAPVNINGVRVGTVERIELKGRGQVLCHLRIKTEEVTVPERSIFTIQTLGLVGAKYIEISLPEQTPGEQPPPAIDPNTVVIGQDPVRVELVMNKIATNLNDMIGKVSSSETQASFLDALKHSGETIKNINEAAVKLNKNMDRVSDATNSIISTSDKFGLAAQDARNLTHRADGFFKEGTIALSGVSDLTKDWRKTTSRVDAILQNPNTVGDLKETAVSMKQMASTIHDTIKELHITLKDKDVNDRLTGLLDRINKSTADISTSMQELSRMSKDSELRGDLKEVVQNAKEAMAKLDDIFSDKDFKGDVRQTMQRVNRAADDVDSAAKQLHEILGKRGPLLHMMFGKVHVKSETPTPKPGTGTAPAGTGTAPGDGRGAPDSGRITPDGGQ